MRTVGTSTSLGRKVAGRWIILLLPQNLRKPVEFQSMKSVCRNFVPITLKPLIPYNMWFYPTGSGGNTGKFDWIYIYYGLLRNLHGLVYHRDRMRWVFFCLATWGFEKFESWTGNRGHWQITIHCIFAFITLSCICYAGHVPVIASARHRSSITSHHGGFNIIPHNYILYMRVMAKIWPSKIRIQLWLWHSKFPLILGNPAC